MNFDSLALNFQAQRIAHWNSCAEQSPLPIGSQQYQKQVIAFFQKWVRPNSRVLEIGCGQGELLAALQPKYGLGIDFSPAQLKKAQAKFPHLHFIEADAHLFKLNETFDIIILSDLLNDVWDVQVLLENLKPVCNPNTRMILNIYSRVWEPVVNLAAQLGLARNKLQQNWLTVNDIQHLLTLSGFEMVQHSRELLLPFELPIISPLANRILAKLFPFEHLCITNFFVAKPAPTPVTTPITVSVIVPARNEAGNIQAVFDRLPRMGDKTELVFVEGNSSDNTWQVIQELIAQHPEWACQAHKQPGKGKGDAVRVGFQNATGDILMILDADLTVAPETLPQFFNAIVQGKGEFINGVRLVYPMEEKAMRFFNLLGNHFFSFAFSWLLGQSIRDTLCGTKVLWKRDYLQIAENRTYFGNFDPFGDFDLLFGAARQHLKIIDLPVRYRERTYGTTNISRWRDGSLLLRMVWFAAKRIKFI
ncbi:MAG TPA: bifunctional class I SAM-dependent methyltransferase/glycosyltransferase family 2 protein [Anaerolineales bacterium]|nr:bifunctional class I SAM-dependent methyltransferase/glycosyltransferase family 2 protein [Anaerolineales bacterium]